MTITKGKTKDKIKEKPKYGILSCVWFMIKCAWTNGEKKVVILGLLFSIVVTGQSVAGLYISPSIIAVLERNGTVSELLITIIGFTLILVFLAMARQYIDSNILYGRITTRSEIINLINTKCAETSYPNLGNEKFQTILNKALPTTYSNSSACEAIWKTICSFLSNLLGLIIYAAILSTANVWILLLVTVTALVGYFVTNKLNSYGYNHREEEAKIDETLSYVRKTASETSFAKDVRIFGIKSWFTELYDKQCLLLEAFHRKCENVYIWGRVADLVLSFLRNAVAYAYFIALVLDGSIDVSMFILYFSTVGGFTDWVTGVLGDLTTMHRQCLELSNVIEILNYPEQFKFEDGSDVPVPADGKYEIVLDHVWFKYPSSDSYTLEDINLTLHAGEKLAVVGLNGAGKTTLVKLITGMEDPTEGRVLLNGVDIREFNRREYYKVFSAVFQNCVLWAGSVAENVAQTDHDIDYDKVNSCIEKAGLTEMVKGFKDGLEEKLNREVYEDAVNLSGGQTQKLMLARALYKDAPVIVLDEPTAALDPIAEADLYNKYNDMTVGRSSVYISHRLASTRFCDRIILIGDHKILEEGTHEQLLKQGGKYAELFEVQSKYYREGDINE
ncbi:MAG: ABC transporter ATP-binding protein/permease [Oscillospiraceae bacterium]|nr:ABC transporter ATP-binding protein/permease [Ruminococcus sp.]MCD8344527.1 ABC transporter ATP-binding protein/permease [Oscillospiraceae bacterium]